MSIKNWVLYILVLSMSVLALMCTYPDTEVVDNTAPVTRLSNIPPTDRVITSKNPRLALSWVGDDPDGYIIGFKYRWSSYKRNPDGSVNPTPYQVRPWSTVLNIMMVDLTVMIDSTYAAEKYAYKVYHYLATLPPEGLDASLLQALGRGDTILIEDVPVFSSNPDNVEYPVHVNPTSGTFIFDSQEEVNVQVFEVHAIDNVSETGRAATVSFNTPQVPPPQTEITSRPFPTDTAFVDLDQTDTFLGIPFSFIARDPNSRTIEYSWKVDNGPWSPFTSNTTAYVTGRDFDDPAATAHTFRVRSRNEFGSIDTVGLIRDITNSSGEIIGYDTIPARATFYSTYPAFIQPGYQKRMLVINNSYSVGAETATVSNPSYQMLEAYYRSILDDAGLAGKYDWVNMDCDKPFPGKAVVSDYSTVMVVGDVVNADGKWYDGSPSSFCSRSLSGRKYEVLQSYCYIGGNLIISARGLGLQPNSTADLHDKLIHANPQPVICFIPPNTTRFFSSNPPKDMAGADGEAGYPPFTFSSSKLAPEWNGGLDKIFGLLPKGFGERIFRYASTGNNGDTSACWENQIIGIRYQGITYSVVTLGFPLYYVPNDTAVAILTRALQDVDEL